MLGSQPLDLVPRFHQKGTSTEGNLIMLNMTYIFKSACTLTSTITLILASAAMWILQL